MTLAASSIGRKVAMALSGLFLVLFLTQHFTINLLSVFSESMFNQVSHFMGNNPIVQFILQPINTRSTVSLHFRFCIRTQKF